MSVSDNICNSGNKHKQMFNLASCIFNDALFCIDYMQGNRKWEEGNSERCGTKRLRSVLMYNNSILCRVNPWMNWHTSNPYSWKQKAKWLLLSVPFSIQYLTRTTKWSLHFRFKTNMSEKFYHCVRRTYSNEVGKQFVPHTIGSWIFTG
jgi:hypothetical protein